MSNSFTFNSNIKMAASCARSGKSAENVVTCAVSSMSLGKLCIKGILTNSHTAPSYLTFTTMNLKRHESEISNFWHKMAITADLGLDKALLTF